MKIQKGEKSFAITDLKGNWKVSRKIGKLTIDIHVSKADYPTFADLEKLVAADKTF